MSFFKKGHKVKLDGERRVRIQKTRKDNATLRKAGSHVSRSSMLFKKNKGVVRVREPFTVISTIRAMQRNLVKIACISVVTVLTVGSIAVFDLHLGNEVIVNGRSVGLITDKKAFEEVLQEVQEIADMTTSTDVKLKPVFIPRVVAGKDVTSDFSLEQNLLQNFSDELVDAHAIYVNKRLLCAVLTEEEAFDALQSVKDKFSPDDGDVEVKFEDDVVVRKELVPVSKFATEDGVVSALMQDGRESDVHVASGNDTVASIAEKFGMTEYEVKALNSGLVSGVSEGQVVNVTRSRPVAMVRTESIETTTQALNYTTRTEDDPNLSSGRTKVVTAGRAGKTETVAKVVRVNGQEVERHVQSEVVVAEPREEVVKVGSGAQVARRGSDGGGNVEVALNLGSGQLTRPTRGTISSRFGSRWGRQHTGIDFSCPVGTPIYAADSGTVTFAGWSGGYGYLIKVNHGNGMETWYAHCSSFTASPGQKVGKGDVIAKSGNTGNSTGPHLHFEVRKGGVPVNPEPYI